MEILSLKSQVSELESGTDNLKTENQLLQDTVDKMKMAELANIKVQQRLKLSAVEAEARVSSLETEMQLKTARVLELEKDISGMNYYNVDKIQHFNIYMLHTFSF